MVVIVILGTLGLCLGIVMVLSSLPSDNLSEVINGVILAGLGGFLLYVGIMSISEPTQKDILTITSKDNKTFSLVIDNPDLKFEKDSLTYCQVDSIINVLVK